jgi:predicted Zn finger-like uncharacterized protein
MLLTCPDCAAEYNVPDHVVDGAPITLRCVRCSREWEVGGADSNPPELEMPSPEPAPPEHQADPVMPAMLQVPPAPLEHLHANLQHDRAIRGGLASWTVSVIVVGLIGWAGIQWRHDVMTAWPPSQRAYQAIGLN